MDRYIINVAFCGKHYCKIELPLGTFIQDARLRARVIDSLFKQADKDFQCSMTCWNDVGRDIPIDG